MSIEEVLKLFYNNKITLNELINYLKPIINKIIDKYPLINFEEYDYLFIETLNICLNNYNENEDFVKYYYNNLNQIFKKINREKNSNDELLTKDEFKMLFYKYKNGNIKARDEIIIRNHRLISSIAGAYLSKCSLFTYDDLFQEGVIGVIKALEKFDFNIGDNFSTYVVWHIRAQIERSILYNDKAIKIPLKIVWKMKNLEEAKQKLKSKLNREATIEELAENLGVTEEEIIYYMLIRQQPMSLNVKTDDDDELELINAIKSDYNLEEKVISNNISMSNKLSCLTEREQLIMKMIIGIEDNRRYTLEEIGACLNMSKQAVETIKKKAIVKLLQLGLDEENLEPVKLSTALIKVKFNDYFLGIKTKDLINYVYELPENYQNIIWEYYNDNFYLISPKPFKKEMFEFIIPYLFNTIYVIDKNKNINNFMNVFLNIDRKTLLKKVEKMALILKRYGSNLNEINVLTIDELKKLYYKDLPNLYNFYLDNRISENMYSIPLKVKYTSLEFTELVQCIKKLTKQEQAVIYSIYGNALNEYNKSNLNIEITNKLYAIIKEYTINKQKLDMSKSNSEVTIISKRKTFLEKYNNYDYITLIELIEMLDEKDLLFYRYGYNLSEFNEINMTNMKRIVKALNDLEDKMLKLNNNELVLKRRSLLEILGITKEKLLDITSVEEQSILYLVYDHEFNFLKECPKKYIKKFNRVVLNISKKLNLMSKENKVKTAIKKQEVRSMTLKEKFNKIDPYILHLFIKHLYYDQSYIIYKVSGINLNEFNKEYNNLSFYYNTVTKLKKMIKGQITIKSLKKKHTIKTIKVNDSDYYTLANEIDSIFDDILIRDYIIYGLIDEIYDVNYNTQEIAFMFEMNINDVENIYNNVKNITNSNKISLSRNRKI